MSKKGFISSYAPYAVMTDAIYGVPASISLAQAALESGYGDSTLARKGNNLFGIKAGGGESGQSFLTKEWDPSQGALVSKEEPFRTYESKWGSFLDHAELLSNDRYKNVKDVPPMQGAKVLAQRGYATDPDYAGKLQGIIKKHDLERFDKYAPVIRILAFLILVGVFYIIAKQLIKYF